MESENQTVTNGPSITDVVWIDPFVIQYQMGEALPCVVAIDHADRDSRWFDSQIQNEAVDPAARDSHQLNYAAWAPPLEHEPLLSFAGECLAHYLKALPQADKFPPFKIQEAYNVLKYEPGQAYHRTHSDYSPNVGGAQLIGDRHLSFVLFLNTVADGGELEFAQQGVQVRPVEGRAVLFPAGWTHAHHTLVTPEDRYVFQLWWSFGG
jgi:hypothetical protein